MDLKKYASKAEMKERKKTTLHVLCVFGKCRRVSYIISAHNCFCTFSSPSLLEMKFSRTFRLVSFLSCGGSKSTSKLNSFQNNFLLLTSECSVTQQTNVFITNVMRLRTNFRCTHAYIASYQQVPNTTYVEVIVTHR